MISMLICGSSHVNTTFLPSSISWGTANLVLSPMNSMIFSFQAGSAPRMLGYILAEWTREQMDTIFSLLQTPAVMRMPGHPPWISSAYLWLSCHIRRPSIVFNPPSKATYPDKCQRKGDHWGSSSNVWSFLAKDFQIFKRQPLGPNQHNLQKMISS